jgi:SAM-dependent methyltransferase
LPASFLRRVLAHPLTASLDLDDPATTHLRRHIIASKQFLRSIYDEWYKMLAGALPEGSGPVLELGSGAGYCAQFIPGLVTSEIFPCPGVQTVIDAAQLPFAANSLRAIVMTNVLHHLPNVRAFFFGAARCLCPGGKILMIEPWMTPWSRFVYTRLHHEPLDMDVPDWAFPSSGPLSSANIALPWIVFERDRSKFAAEFPQFSIEQARPFLPFRYLLSGGVALRSLMPGFTHGVWAGLERALQSQRVSLGMFAFISLQKGAHTSRTC